MNHWCWSTYQIDTRLLRNHVKKQSLKHYDRGWKGIGIRIQNRIVIDIIIK